MLGSCDPASWRRAGAPGSSSHPLSPIEVLKPAGAEAGKARGGDCTALPPWRRHTGTLDRRPLGESLKKCSYPIVLTCSRSVGHRLRQVLLHPLPGPVAVLKIPFVSSFEPAGWVEDQDVRGGSSDCSVSRTSAAPASKSKKETARRPGRPGRLKQNRLNKRGLHLAGLPV